MSDKNDRCERCDRVFFYDGHTDWCQAIGDLEERVLWLEKHVHVIAVRHDGEEITSSQPKQDE